LDPHPLHGFLEAAPALIQRPPQPCDQEGSASNGVNESGQERSLDWEKARRILVKERTSPLIAAWRSMVRVLSPAAARCG
jgi:hypothetical protein